MINLESPVLMLKYQGLKTKMTSFQPHVYIMRHRLNQIQRQKQWRVWELFFKKHDYGVKSIYCLSREVQIQI